MVIVVHRCSRTLQNILEGLMSGVNRSSESHISVRRHHIWKDSLCMFARPSFDAQKQIHVSFVGEEAVDVGGPRREYWRLLMKSIANSSALFDGPEECKVIAHNFTAQQQRHFYFAGVMISCCVLQGGPGFPFLAPSIYSYISGMSTVIPTVEEVVDFEVRSFLSEVNVVMLFLIKGYVLNVFLVDKYMCMCIFSV